MLENRGSLFLMESRSDEVSCNGGFQATGMVSYC
jgi:hypothetical protein